MCDSLLGTSSSLVSSSCRGLTPITTGAYGLGHFLGEQSWGHPAPGTQQVPVRKPPTPGPCFPTAATHPHPACTGPSGGGAQVRTPGHPPHPAVPHQQRDRPRRGRREFTGWC